MDVGNHRVKLGSFPAPREGAIPTPAESFHLSGSPIDPVGLEGWLDRLGGPEAAWWIGSVNRPSATRLIDWLRDRTNAEIVLLAAGDLPLRVEVPRPDMVGVDRLLDAVAANAMRDPDRPAVIVDVGTAVTVDLVGRDGAFRGGAILPGITMAAWALHELTDLLPQIDAGELTSPPDALGADTEAAMRSGLFWGAVGAVRELVARLGDEAGGRAQVFLTGGAGPAVAGLLGPEAVHVPHLTLGGIALSAWAREG